MSMRVVTFKIELDDFEKMEAVRLGMNVGRSEFIRRAIKYYLEHEFKDRDKVPTAKVEKGVRL